VARVPNDIKIYTYGIQTKIKICLYRERIALFGNRREWKKNKNNSCCPRQWSRRHEGSWIRFRSVGIILVIGVDQTKFRESDSDLVSPSLVTYYYSCKSVCGIFRVPWLRVWHAYPNAKCANQVRRRSTSAAALAKMYTRNK